MRIFLQFLTKLKGFWKLYKNYEYDGETVEFIIENYQDVLQNRTKPISKPTYYARDVIGQIDEWHKKRDEKYRFEIVRKDDKLGYIIEEI